MNFWAVPQKPSHQFTGEGDNSHSLPLLPTGCSQSSLPLSRGESKTLFIQFIWQTELITVPGRVQNYLTSKPREPASCNAKPGTEYPCIHQEPHTAQLLSTLVCTEVKNFSVTERSTKYCYLYYKTHFRYFTFSVELQNELQANLYYHLILSSPEGKALHTIFSYLS